MHCGLLLSLIAAFMSAPPGPEEVGDADQVVRHHMQPERSCRLGSPSGFESPSPAAWLIQPHIFSIRFLALIDWA
mgnify:CR=1 FL=1